MKNFSYNVWLIADYFSVYTHVNRIENAPYEWGDSDDIIDEALEMMRSYGMNPKIFNDIQILDCHEIEDMGAA